MADTLEAEDSADSAPIAADSDTLANAGLNRQPPVLESNSVQSPQIPIEEALAMAANKGPIFDTTEGNNAEHSYCPECYLPLHPDPKPDRLYIFLHAHKYTTSLGEFSTDLPQWAREGWSWEESTGSTCDYNEKA